MKTNKKNITSQRQIIERKIRPWVPLREDKIPQSGWIKAIRGALGLNTRQLADFLGVDHSAVLRLEEREAKGKVTLDLISKVAQAMSCKLIYAIVPEKPYEDLESILDERTIKLARELTRNVEHSMRLEQQGTDAEHTRKHAERLAYDLKAKADSRIWDKPSAKGGVKK